MITTPTPPELLLGPDGSPYWLWDHPLPLEAYIAKLRSPDPEEAAYWLAKGLREAKPDDMMQLVSLAEVAAAWPRIERHLGRQRALWRWWLERAGHHV